MNLKRPHILLASQSPRRRQLIKLLNLPYSWRSVPVNEDQITLPDLTQNVIERARLKAAALGGQITDNDVLIVAADTMVAHQSTVMNKPENLSHARQMLQQLRNKSHHVHTGLVLYRPADRPLYQTSHTAVVTMRNYSDAEIDAYLATGDPLDKAGAYAIQHPVFKPVAVLDGCFLSVMGLSICQVLLALHQLNIFPVVDLDALRQAHGDFPNCPLYQQFGHIT